MLAVIAASASIRLGTRIDGDAARESTHAARLVRQSAGALTALGVLSLAIGSFAVRAMRGMYAPWALGALALTAALSGVGLVAGREPPPAAAFANQFGGLLLAGILGWMLGLLRARPMGRRSGDPYRLACAALAIALAQAALGGAIATLLSDPPVIVLLLHAAAGLAAAACILAVAIGCGGVSGTLLAASSAAVLGIGVLSAIHAPSSALQVGHAFGGALLLTAAAYACGRFDPA
jgi:hypothetical protein